MWFVRKAFWCFKCPEHGEISDDTEKWHSWTVFVRTGGTPLKHTSVDLFLVFRHQLPILLLCMISPELSGLAVHQFFCLILTDPQPDHLMPFFSGKSSSSTTALACIAGKSSFQLTLPCLAKDFLNRFCVVLLARHQTLHVFCFVWENEKWYHFCVRKGRMIYIYIYKYHTLIFSNSFQIKWWHCKLLKSYVL